MFHLKFEVCGEKNLKFVLDGSDEFALIWAKFHKSTKIDDNNPVNVIVIFYNHYIFIYFF